MSWMKSVQVPPSLAATCICPAADYILTVDIPSHTASVLNTKKLKLLYLFSTETSRNHHKKYKWLSGQHHNPNDQKLHKQLVRIWPFVTVGFRPRKS